MKTRLIIGLITIISCFLIYKTTNYKEGTLMAIGDGSCLASSLNKVPMISYNDLLYKYLKSKRLINNYNNDYCYNALSIKGLNELIKANDKKDVYKIQYLLDNAKYITIMIGFDELTSYKRVDNNIKREFLNEYNDLIKLIKKYSKASIFVVGFYSNYFKDSDYINSRIKQICINNNINYIDISDLSDNKDYFYSLNRHNLNINGHEIIFARIKEKI